MEEMNKTINLLIKAPNQKISDYPLECQIDWTVKYLKVHISETYPGKPAVEDQKLIYSGRLLHDHLKLKDILRYDEKGPHILHLVCNTKQSLVTPLTSTVKETQNCAHPFPSTSSSNEDGIKT
ncbi:homocysteine-responsive endoplasmic reticulum-resident ubiquitin-like domain member 2 protein [Centruroides vittatus]|uniref:homocysteine-responsive endoplasmic reticulum-resident ubiquitin-like domain member 2 protein n=1 Tax=Centruroides vittatus TaxID=120091 RepID=UPI00350ED153